MEHFFELGNHVEIISNGIKGSVVEVNPDLIIIEEDERDELGVYRLHDCDPNDLRKI